LIRCSVSSSARRRRAIASAGYFDPASVGKLVRKCAAGRAIGFGDNMAFMAILSTMLVHHQFILGESIDPA